ncbi:hypothetical protein [Emcibacter sp.]|uniref:hypothetical protein n=1 Tax=Emcibacter sp. TaxID=1979954 RepID=UPI002AA81D41|nr:hypothetical protein [Emcibacter sp.]
MQKYRNFLIKKGIVAKILISLISTILFPPIALAEDVSGLWDTAMESYNRQKYLQFEEFMIKLSVARPYNLAVQKNLLRAYLLNTHVDQAGALLENILAQKVYIDIVTDEDFRNIATDEVLASLSAADPDHEYRTEIKKPGRTGLLNSVVKNNQSALLASLLASTV